LSTTYEGDYPQKRQKKSKRKGKQRPLGEVRPNVTMAKRASEQHGQAVVVAATRAMCVSGRLRRIFDIVTIQPSARSLQLARHEKKLSRFSANAES
jgi:hypothetical protein